MFGGELLAQALTAASRTVPSGDCHALHAHFLAPGNPSAPLEYRVRSVRDGRRFAQRQVSAWQRGREVLLATLSFTAQAVESPAWQQESMPAVAGPEGLPSEHEHRLAMAHRMRPEDRGWLLAPRGVEVRPVQLVPLFDPPVAPPVANTWLRAVGRLPDDPALHRAILAYASDLTLLDVACYPLGRSWIDPGIEQASLDHAIWFHRDFRADDWLLHAQSAPVAVSGRALARGSIFSHDGRLVASVAQEGVSALRR